MKVGTYDMEANAGDEGIHFQSYPFDFLEFLNHQRFEPMEFYNHHDHGKPAAVVPCTSPSYECSPQNHTSNIQPTTDNTSKPKEFKLQVPSSISTPKKSESVHIQCSNHTSAPSTQAIFDGALNTQQWGIVGLSSHQLLFNNIKRSLPATQEVPDEKDCKDDKNYFRRLKYLLDRRFPCTVCQKSFKQSSHLMQHMLVHTGERPYECNVCGRSYNHISSLIRHRRCHKEGTEDESASTVLPTDAETAAATAVVAAAMSESHINSVEMPVAQVEANITVRQDGPFTCNMCWKVFKKQSHLHQHQIIHTGEKPFSCTVCEKSFNRRESLKRHVKTHSDSLKVYCEVCGKAFRDTTYLLKHQATHTGGRPEYSCDVCGKSYATTQSLLRHKQSHEQNVPLLQPTLPQNSLNETTKEPSASASLETTSLPFSDVVSTDQGAMSVVERIGSAMGHSSSVRRQSSLSTNASKNFCCNICGRGFGRRETLKRHERIHTGEKPHQCPVCGKRFRESFHLTKHHVVHTRERPYKCELCGKVFGYPQSLTRHKQIHRLQLPCTVQAGVLTPEHLPFGCTDCGQKFPDSFHLMNHKELHMSDKPYVCDICRKCFGFIENLMWHKLVHQTAPECLIPVNQCQEATETSQMNCMQNGLIGTVATTNGVTATDAATLTFTSEEHPMIPSGERFSCTICGQSFKHFLGLVTHKYVHLVRRTMACNVCGQSFTGAYDLLLHRRSHLQKRHFSCSICGKRFWEAVLLMRHQRCHTEERPYRCTICGRGFLHSWYLRQHKVVHTGERAYKCALCNKRFAQSSSLAEHQRLHTVARPQRCPTCGKTFRYRSNLIEHQRVHLGEKVYRCDQCGKSFFYISSILRHQRSHDAKADLRCSCCLKLFKDPKYFNKHIQTHQGGRPFKCGACGEAFSNTYGLKKHRQEHKAEKFAAAAAVAALAEGGQNG